MSVITMLILPDFGMPAMCFLQASSWRLTLPARVKHMLSDIDVNTTSSSKPGDGSGGSSSGE